MKNRKFALIYASDSTYITKLDRLCKESPDMYSPLDEIADAMSDTGFIVHGRYDLETQSGIGTRAGLTDEQKKQAAERMRKY